MVQSCNEQDNDKSYGRKVTTQQITNKTEYICRRIPKKHMLYYTINVYIILSSDENATPHLRNSMLYIDQGTTFCDIGWETVVLTQIVYIHIYNVF